jgi:predicted component of type VI protein secretion system
MQLKLGFELDTNVATSKGAAVVDLDFFAANGQAVVTVRNVKIDSNNFVLDVGSRVLAQPLRTLLAQQLSKAINEAIADLPNQVSALKKVEIMGIQN